MWKLAAVLYPIIATSLAGVAVLVALIAPDLGLATMRGMTLLGLSGLAAGAPVSIILGAIMAARASRT